MSSLQLGRLLLGPPQSWSEATGNALQSQGGVAVPAERTAPQFQVALATWAADGSTDTLAARLTIRRQLRAILNNAALIQQGYLYVIYSDDSEQNGWYQPDVGQLTDLTSPAGLATGLFQLQNPWYAAGKRRTHREAREVWMKNLTTNLYARDYLGLIVSSDFSALPTLQLSVLPNGCTGPVVTVSGQVLAGVALPTGRDGGTCIQVQGQSDQTVISYERVESALNLSDVIVYDRMGQITAPSTGPDTSWAEVGGNDWPWNWLTGGANDCPVLDNGLVRVRYESSNTPGFKVDVWNGSAYVEQGKMLVLRTGDLPQAACNTWLSANLVEYTPDRAVLNVVMENNADTYSHESVYITVQRGELGVTFECYPALGSTGAQADAGFLWTMNGPDSNDSVMWEPSTAQPPSSSTDQIWSTASSNWSSGAGTFSGITSNYVSILRCIGGATTVGPYQTTLAVVQGNSEESWQAITDARAYGGSAQNTVRLFGVGAGLGYFQTQLAFTATQSDQVQGSVSSWSAAITAHYRVFKLVSGTWTDLGEYTGTPITTTSATRVEAYLTQDRTRNGAYYGGSRDIAQAALQDSRQLGALTARR